MDYSGLIEYILTKIGSEFKRVENYYMCRNPMIDEKHSSFQWFIDGWGKSYNGDINGKSRLSIKEICKLTGFLTEYIEFTLNENDIPIYKFSKYKELLIKKSIGEKFNIRDLNILKSLFSKLYISQTDVLQSDSVKKITINKYQATVKTEAKADICEIGMSFTDELDCSIYLESRGLAKKRGILDICRLKINNFKLNAVAFRYPDGFTKYRLINSKMRYICKGDFNKLYVSRKSRCRDLAYCVEGEIESECLAKFTSKSVYAMHNVNSIKDLTELKKYDRIVVLVDNDKYIEVRSGLHKKLSGLNSNVLCKVPTKIAKKYSSNVKEVDLNWLLINDENYIKKLVDKIESKCYNCSDENEEGGNIWD